MKKIYTCLSIVILIFLCNFKSSAFDIVLDFTNATCEGAANGHVTITPLGGTAPYLYSIDGGLTFQSSNYFDGLAGGNSYAVIVTDALSDLGYQNLSLPLADPLTAASTLIPTRCSEGNGGSIVINSTNATSPFSFSMNNWPLPNTVITSLPGAFTDLYAGTYVIDINDALGCFGGLVLTILNGDSLTGTAHIKPPSCTGSADAIMQFDFPNAVEPFTLYDPAWGVLNNMTNYSAHPNEWVGDFGAGTYVWSVQDATGCIGSITTVIPAGLPAFTNAGSDKTVCNGGSVQLSGSDNGTLMGEGFEWLPATGLSDPGIANPVASPAETTTYTLTTACVWTTGTYCITVDEVTIAVTRVDIPLVELSNHILSVTNIQAGINYTWQKREGTTWTDIGTGTNYHVTSSDVYRVRASAGNCEEYSSQQLAARPASTNSFGIYTYPNPATSFLKLDELKLSDGWQSAEILNSQGRSVTVANDIRNKTSVVLYVANLSSGTYMLKLTGSDGKLSTIRFIKQ